MNQNEKDEEERKKYKAILEKYPFLAPRYVDGKPIEMKEDDDYLLVTCFKNGWDEIFFKICDVIKKAWLTWDENTKNNFWITDIKEKFGEMRIYTTFINDEIDAAIDIGSFLSRYTCMACGAQPKDIFGRHKIWLTNGYVMPFCKSCIKKLGYKRWTVDRHSGYFVTLSFSKELSIKKTWLCKTNDDILRAAPIEIKKIKDK